jgi:hypothetical protein
MPYHDIASIPSALQYNVIELPSESSKWLDQKFEVFISTLEQRNQNLKLDTRLKEKTKSHKSELGLGGGGGIMKILLFH